MNGFVDFVRSAGLIPGDILQDGNWRRCATETHPRKRNGSYKLAADGLVGWAQNFEIDSDPRTWRPDNSDALDKIDFAAIARRRAAERRALAQATQAARKFYSDCAPLKDGHPYLDSHGLNMAGCLGLKIDASGWLVVPVLIERNLMSVQRISPAGDKLFWSGASVKGASYAIGRPNASITVLCEGLATGLAIFAAAPLARLVVAFNAGNMARVQIPRRGMAVVAADNDHGTAAKLGHNPGLDAAHEAAESLGCGVAVPTGIEGTDWCDYRKERVAFLLADRPKERESSIRRAVDAEIAAAMSRNAKFLRGAVAA
jgi:putative DNA primase/helicase